jgi:hypothetical protein
MAYSYDVMNARWNIQMSLQHPNWYELLPKVKAAMAVQDQEWRMARDAGWDGDEGGLVSPWGHAEQDWVNADLPLPYEKDYADFIEKFGDRFTDDCDLDPISEDYVKYYFELHPHLKALLEKCPN